MHGGGTILLQGFDVNDLDASDFVFAGETSMADETVHHDRFGSNALYGREGADVFVFGPDNGYDTIFVFTNGEDVIDLSAFSTISGFSDLTITSGSPYRVHIDLSAHGGGRITLEGVDIDDLDAEDFRFRTDEGGPLLDGGGTSWSDVLQADDDDDHLDGGAGHDRLYGGAGDDVLLGGEGDDRLYGREGNDRLEGEGGRRHGSRVATAPTTSGAARATTISWAAPATTPWKATWATTGSSAAQAMTNCMAMTATTISRVIAIVRKEATTRSTAARATTSLIGKAGDDNGSMAARATTGSSLARAGDDRLYGGAGSDQLSGNSGDDELYGGERRRLSVWWKRRGRALRRRGRRHTLRLRNNSRNGLTDGADTLYGGGGDDRLHSGEGDDELYGGSGDDILGGGAGNDTHYGGSGDDTLGGGSGDETRSYSPRATETTPSQNFTDGEDVIDLTAFSGISSFEDLTITSVRSNAVIDLTEYGGGTIRLIDTRCLRPPRGKFRDFWVLRRLGRRATPSIWRRHVDGSTDRVALGSVSATGPDGGSVTYGIERGNAAGLFEIDGASGELFYTGGGEDYETDTRWYELTVRASDGDQATVTTVTVAVTNVDEPDQSTPQTVSEPAGEDFPTDPSTSGRVAVGDTATGTLSSNDEVWPGVPQLVCGRRGLVCGRAGGGADLRHRSERQSHGRRHVEGS